MRKIFIALCTMVSVITGNAQNTPIGENIELAGENPEELKVIYVNKDVSTHFIAMEDIKYVDISVNDIVGDIPTGNSLRIKPTKEGASGVITIVNGNCTCVIFIKITSPIVPIINRDCTDFFVICKSCKSVF